ncbi:MAG: ParB/RepB/Spo0J family partition protein, partial [bacterium]
TKCNLTQDEVSKKVGKDRSTITNSLRILKLPDIIQESIIKGDITAGHARALLGLPNKKDQIELWKKTIKNKYSVRQVENSVKNKTQPAKPKKEIQQKVNPFIRETEDKLRSILATQVRISEHKKGRGGKVEIEYYSNTDLERILELIERI